LIVDSDHLLQVPTVFIAVPQHGFKAFQPIVVIEVIGSGGKDLRQFRDATGSVLDQR